MEVKNHYMYQEAQEMQEPASVNIIETGDIETGEQTENENEGYFGKIKKGGIKNNICLIIIGSIAFLLLSGLIFTICWVVTQGPDKKSSIRSDAAEAIFTTHSYRLKDTKFDECCDNDEKKRDYVAAWNKILEPLGIECTDVIEGSAIITTTSKNSKHLEIIKKTIDDTPHITVGDNKHLNSNAVSVTGDEVQQQIIKNSTKEKDQEIEKQKEEIRKKDQDITKKDQEIENLKKNVLLAKNANPLPEETDRMKQIIENLKNDVSHLKNDVSQKDQDITKQNQKIEALKNLLGQRNQEISNLTKERDQEIATNTAKIEEQNQKIKDLTKELKNNGPSAQMYDEKKQEIEQQKEHIDKLKAECASNEQEIRTMNKTVSHVNNSIKEKEQEIADLKKYASLNKVVDNVPKITTLPMSGSITADTPTNRGFNFGFNLNNPAPRGKVYYIVLNEQRFVTAHQIMNKDVPAADSICWGSFAQAASASKVVGGCNLSRHVKYYVYGAADVDGNKTNPILLTGIPILQISDTPIQYAYGGHEDQYAPNNNAYGGYEDQYGRNVGIGIGQNTSADEYFE